MSTIDATTPCFQFHKQAESKQWGIWSMEFVPELDNLMALGCTHQRSKWGKEKDYTPDFRMLTLVDDEDKMKIKRCDYRGFKEEITMKSPGKMHVMGGNLLVFYDSGAYRRLQVFAVVGDEVVQCPMGEENNESAVSRIVARCDKM
eukprot:TRINITY_DN850_c0_g1_i1.p2 TRINITY_DN850_c0_g1~~TRINITY_DN850_c0_g1_i1.p2  ORF type:complete len:146 (-),score=34.05 TRINITY_DN850_c0_g1_i1:48-485(-)